MAAGIFHGSCIFLSRALRRVACAPLSVTLSLGSLPQPRYIISDPTSKITLGLFLLTNLLLSWISSCVFSSVPEEFVWGIAALFLGSLLTRAAVYCIDCSWIMLVGCFWHLKWDPLL